MRALRVAWIAALLPALCAQTTSVHDLLASVRKQVQSADYRVTGHLVRVQPDGARVSLPVTLKARWFPGVLRVLVETANAPKTGPGSLVRARTATHALLEMRPTGQSSIWIAHSGDKSPTVLPFEKWSDGLLGSGFSYEDLLEDQYFWPSQTSDGQAKFGARKCEVVRSSPGSAERSHYASVKTWFDPTIAFPVYVEKTVKETGTVKEFTYFGIRHEEGVWSAHQIEEKTRGQAGSTLLIIDRGSARANLTLNDFSLAQLSHF
jgi:Outer membrane lipoprotein-sorting protein